MHDQHAAAQVRLQQATLDLQVLRDRAETVQAELRAAQHARARSEEAARGREQALRNEFKTSLAAVQEQAVDLQARLAQQAAQGEQRASADASALAAAQDRIAELDGAHGELAALKATRERLAADLSHTQARLLEQTAHAQDAGWALEQAREHAARQLAEFTQLLRRPWWQRLLQPTPPVVATLAAAMPPAAAPPASGSGNLMSTKTPEPIRHVNQLLALHGAEFLTAAYREVLGREPDAPGGAAYLQRLQTEHNKAAVLCEFVTCPEGQERRQTLPGLAELAAIRDPGHGRLRRFLNKFARLDQAAVRIEWLVGAMHQQMSAELSAGQAKTEQVLAALQDLSRRVDHQVAECSLRIDTAVDRMSQQITQLSRLQESTAAQLALYEEHRNLDSDMQARRLSRDREFLLQQQAALVSDTHRGTPAAGAAVAPLLTVNDLLLLAQNARSPGN